MLNKKELVLKLNINKKERIALNKIEEEGRREIFSIKRVVSNLYIETVNCHTRVIERYSLGTGGKINEIKEV